MKTILPIQQIIGNQIGSDKNSASQGILFTWGASEYISNENTNINHNYSSYHCFNKSHYLAIRPDDFQSIARGEKIINCPLGHSNLTYFNDESINDVRRSISKTQSKVLALTDFSSLKNDQWLANLSVDKFLDIKQLHKLSRNIVESVSNLDYWENSKRVVDFYIANQSLENIPGSLFLICSSDIKIVNLLSSSIFSFFPESIVIGTPYSSECRNSFPSSPQPLRLPDSAVCSSTTYRKGNSILFRSKVTAIINLYKRANTCIEIYRALLSQSFPPFTIYIWVNGQISEHALLRLRKEMPLARFILSDENLGVWARFSFGLNISTEYTVIFDDDTIPGRQWIENCITCMINRPALYGTVGLIYNQPISYMNHTRIGWPAPNSEPTVVDIVGHSWFFKTEWLKNYWYSTDDIDSVSFCGEDMHFSFALQKIGIPTIVPPHPSNNKELWGSIKGYEAGTGQEAISISGKGSMMDIPLQHLLKRGFKLLRSDS